MCLGIPGRIVEIVDGDGQRAIAEVDGVRREISLVLLGARGDDGTVTSPVAVDGAGAVGVSDWVLIHVGFAMSRIDEDEAAETLRALRAYGDPYRQEVEEYGVGGAMDPLEMFAEEIAMTGGPSLPGSDDPTRLPRVPDSAPSEHQP